MLRIILVQKRRQLRAKDALANRCAREEQDNVFPVHRQRGGDFGADEPAANHREALAALGQPAQPLVIVERAIVDHIIAAPGQAPWSPAGRQEQFVEGVDGSLVIPHRFAFRIEHARDSSQNQLDSLLSDVDPHILLGRAFPERLGERWPLVGGMVLAPDHPNSAGRIELTNTVNGSRRRHAAANDQIGIVRHGFLLLA